MHTKSKFISAAKRVSLVATVFLLLAGAARLPAADGTWTNDFDSIWSDSTNWLDAVVADGSGATASFNNVLASIVTVNLDTPKSIANLLFVNGTYTITNNGDDGVNILTLEGPAKPNINAAAASVQTIRRTVVAGTNAFVLDGGGQLNFFKEDTDPANTISGGVILSNGLLVVQGINVDNDNIANNLAVASFNSFTFYNGTLNLRPAPNTSPSYGNVNGNLIVPEGGTGSLILPVRWAGSSGDGGGAGSGFGGSLTGSGTLNVETKYVRNNVVGNWSGFTGQLNVTANATGGGDEFRVAFAGGLPNAALDLGGAVAFTFRYYPGIAGNSNFPIGILTGSNPNAFMAGSASGAFRLTYDIGALRTNATDVDSFAGSIVNGAGPAGLLKRGAGTQVIVGNNTYSGGTTISNGVLQIGDGFSDSGNLGTGPVTNYTALVLARGGAMNVTAAISGPGSLTNNGFGGVTALLGANTYTGPTTVLVGELKVGGASQATGSYTVADGAALGALMTSPSSTTVFSSSSFGTGCSFNFDLSTFSNPSTAIATNTGNIALNSDVTVNVLASGLGLNLSPGTITLLEYGSRSGAGNFVLGTLPPNVTATFNDDKPNNRLTLTITVVFNPTLVWIGDTVGNWDVDNTANAIWKIAGSGVITNFYNGVPTRFDDTATGTNVANLTTTVSPFSVIVDNTTKSYTFGGVGDISGEATLTKQGDNTLTIANFNTYSGATRVNAGILQIGNGVDDGALGTGPITNNSSIVANNVNPFTMGNLIAGTGGITQIGLGTVTISANNFYSGGVTVTPGTTVGLNNAGAAGIGGGINVTSGTLLLGADIGGAVGNVTVITNGTFRAGANRVINPAVVGTNVTILVDKNATGSLITFNGSLSGVSGTVINTNGGTMRFNSGGGNICIGSTDALFSLQAGTTLQNRNGGTINLGGLEGEGNIGGPQNANNATVNFSIGAMNTSTLYSGTIFDNNTNANNRLTGITKVGSGTLTMSNALLTYFGPTVINDGILLLKGSTGLSNTTPITVVSPGVLDVTALDTGELDLGQVGLIQVGRIQTLRGSGTIQGNVVLGDQGRLEPGVGDIGTLTVNGNVTLSGGSSNVMEITTTGGPASDNLVANNITYGGTLILSTVGTIGGSNTFQLFSGSLSGAFANVITQSVSGLTWDLSKLDVDGTVTLVGVSVTPTNITAVADGNGNITVSWPFDHTGWQLQAQTNSVSVGITGTWFDVPGSTTTNMMNIPIGETNGTVFFRLILP